MSLGFCFSNVSGDSYGWESIFLRIYCINSTISPIFLGYGYLSRIWVIERMDISIFSMEDILVSRMCVLVDFMCMCILFPFGGLGWFSQYRQNSRVSIVFWVYM